MTLPSSLSDAPSGLPRRVIVAGVIVMIAIAAGYAAAFPGEPNLGPADITRELAFFVAVVARHVVHAS